MAEDLGRELSFDDEISAEGEPYEPLPAGVYSFTVASMERGRFPGSEKMATCPTANIDMVVVDANGSERHVFDTLYLNSKAEWRISSFFIAIGQKKKGEPFRPNWNFAGATGRFELSVNEYTNKNGEQRKNNRVKRYLEPEKKGYVPGKF